MTVRQFRLMVAGEVTEGGVDRLFERAGDVSVEVHAAAGAAWVAFDRPAPTLVDAMVSGVRDLDVAGLAIGSAAPDDPLVSLEVIAARVERPVDVVRAWAAGDFPAPVGPHPRRPVYHWPDVAAWLARRRIGAQPDEEVEEVTARAVTLALQLRALAPRLERMAPIRSLLYT